MFLNACQSCDRKLISILRWNEGTMTDISRAMNLAGSNNAATFQIITIFSETGVLGSLIAILCKPDFFQSSFALWQGFQL
jgi:hypothetical protein